MTRQNAANYSNPGYAYATADTDGFDRLDVAGQGQAMDNHDHSSGNGLAVARLAAGAIPAGSITSAMIADGTIATADLANASVTNAKLASDTARANLLTNGGFEVWQRGNGPYASNGTFTADRWYLSIVGTDTLSLSRNTANADTARGSIACGACTFTLGSGAGATCFLQVLKATDSYQIKGQTVSLSVRVSTATATAVRVGLHDGSAWTYSSFHTGAGGYQTLTVTATVGAAADLQVGIFFAATCTAYLDNAMLVVGSVAADYVGPHPADELARCERYYELPVGDGTETAAWYLYAAAGSVAGIPLVYHTPKPVTPTVTKTGTWGVVNCNQPVIAGSGKAQASVYATAIALGATQFNTTTNAYLTVESIP